jgi:hypothetical protein
MPPYYWEDDFLEVVKALGPLDSSEKLDMTTQEFESFLRRATAGDTNAVHCIANHLQDHYLGHLLERHVAEGCAGASSGHTRDLNGTFPVTNFACYSRKFKAKFLQTVWPELEEFVKTEKDKEVAHTFFGMFKRGDHSAIHLHHSQEESVHKDFFFDAQINVKFGHELNKIRLPYVFHSFVYLQAMISYNIVQLLKALQLRMQDLTPAFGTPKNDTEVERYQERVAACKACIAEEKGFCDDHIILLSMQHVKADAVPNGVCMPKTVESLKKCHKIAGNYSKETHTGLLYRKQMCPCFEAVTGQEFKPAWITTENECEELLLENKGEELRKANKLEDYSLGFFQKDNKPGRLDLGSRVVFLGRTKCNDGYRCCGSRIHGGELLRCVKDEDLLARRNLGFFGKLIGKGARCTEFDPHDAAVRAQPGAAWSHIRNQFRCAPTQLYQNFSHFNGHWSIHPGNNTWMKDPEE